VTGLEGGINQNTTTRPEKQIKTREKEKHRQVVKATISNEDQKLSSPIPHNWRMPSKPLS